LDAPFYSPPKTLVKAFRLSLHLIDEFFRGPVAWDRGGFSGFRAERLAKNALDETAAPDIQPV